MTALITVLGYVAVILIGIFIRAQGLVPRDLAKPVGFLVLNITLPCAIITFLNGVTLPVELLATILIPITATWIMIGIAWLMTHRRPDRDKAVPFAMLNMSSFNVGTFAMPFTMGLVSPLGFLVVCLFDIGNAIMCTGGTYAFAFRGNGGALKALMNVFRTLAHAAPIWTYLILIPTFYFLKRPVPIKDIFLEAFDRKLLLNVVMILYFISLLSGTGVLDETLAALKALPLPTPVIFAMLSVLVGLLTGMSQGYIAMAMPICAAIAPGSLTYAGMAMVFGCIGQMLTPVHLCFTISVDYFKADFFQSFKQIFICEAILAVIFSAWTYFTWA